MFLDVGPIDVLPASRARSFSGAMRRTILKSLRQKFFLFDLDYVVWLSKLSGDVKGLDLMFSVTCKVCSLAKSGTHYAVKDSVRTISLSGSTIRMYWNSIIRRWCPFCERSAQESQYHFSLKEVCLCLFVCLFWGRSWFPCFAESIACPLSVAYTEFAECLGASASFPLSWSFFWGLRDCSPYPVLTIPLKFL